MRSLRRFAVFLALGFAFGGFLFYAAVVVPIGTGELGPTTQGFVTRHVTKVMNIANLVAVALLAADWVAERNGRSRSQNALVSICGLAILTLTIVQFWLHPRLESQLDPEEIAVLNPQVFYGLHRIYLWLSTAIWLLSLPVGWVFANAQGTELKSK